MSPSGLSLLAAYRGVCQLAWHGRDQRDPSGPAARVRRGPLPPSTRVRTHHQGEHQPPSLWRRRTDQRERALPDGEAHHGHPRRYRAAGGFSASSMTSAIRRGAGASLKADFRTYTFATAASGSGLSKRYVPFVSLTCSSITTTRFIAASSTVASVSPQRSVPGPGTLRWPGVPIPRALGDSLGSTLVRPLRRCGGAARPMPCIRPG